MKHARPAHHRSSFPHCLGEYSFVCRMTQHIYVLFQKYNGRYFQKTNLQALGFELQLGHYPGEHCSNPHYGPRDFMVIHTNGMHPVTVLFCNCDRLLSAGNRVQQLLRYELYLATITDPTTCMTFRALESFHELTHQSQINGYDFYKTLDHLTDNTGISISWVSSQSCLMEPTHVQ